jgi:tetratricopeptide (TPR) repeat protein
MSPEVARTLNGLASAVEALGRLDEAEQLYRRSLQVRRTLFPDGHPEVAVTLSNLAMLLQNRGDLDSAEPLYREALTNLDGFLPEEHPTRAVILRNLADLLTARGAAAEAEATARRALDILQAAGKPGSWRIADAESVLGGALAALGHYQEATPLLLGSYTRLQDLRGKEAPYTRQALDRIVELYRRTGNEERAEQYRALQAR